MNVRKIKSPGAPNSVPSEQKSMAFGNEETPISFKKGLKLDNTKSTIPENLPKEQDFRDRVNQILSEEEEQKKLALQLTQKFVSMLKDKTLDEAKDVRVRDNEKQAIRDLIDFCRLINSDPNQEDEMGTMSIIATALRGLFIQRDRINELEYRCFNLESEVRFLLAQKPEK